MALHHDVARDSDAGAPPAFTSVLITGGAGFIGSHVLCRLVRRYPRTKFVCLDSLEYCATVHNLADVWNAPNFHFIKGSTTSADLVDYAIITHKIDCIVNFAAQSHVDNSFGNSFAFTEANVIGTHVLLEASKKHCAQIVRFIHVSTDEVYGESSMESDEEFHETAALNPNNPYAATKAAAEFLVRAYQASFNVPAIITRGNNVYGPRQYPEKLIPKFISLLLQDQPCPIHGNGDHRRSFIFVSDVAAAFDVILHSGVIGAVYNVGTNFEISNLDVAYLLIEHMQMPAPRSKYIEFVEDRNFNDCRYKIDYGLLEQLGWNPVVSFRDGLSRTIEWYRNHGANHWNDISRALRPHPRRDVNEEVSVHLLQQ